MLTKAQKAKAIKKLQKHDADTGSASVQVSILSARIEELSEHLKQNRKDRHSRRGLLKMVETRRKHLKYLKRTDPKTYKETIAAVGLKK